mmetsp:Transcript_152726/g.470259  ORF Transcript_152726/g.470259 Transcript_152726/m.470259 type:complete len:91 (-) Transcript_152726:77-349(-)
MDWAASDRPLALSAPGRAEGEAPGLPLAEPGLTLAEVGLPLVEYAEDSSGTRGASAEAAVAAATALLGFVRDVTDEAPVVAVAVRDAAAG